MEKRWTNMYAYLVGLVMYYRRSIPVLPLMWLIHLLWLETGILFSVRHVLLIALIMAYDPAWDAAERIVIKFYG